MEEPRTERRWVLDTNTLVSRLLVPGGTAGQAVDCALARGVLLVSVETLDELTEGSRPHQVRSLCADQGSTPFPRTTGRGRANRKHHASRHRLSRPARRQVPACGTQRRSRSHHHRRCRSARTAPVSRRGDHHAPRLCFYFLIETSRVRAAGTYCCHRVVAAFIVRTPFSGLKVKLSTSKTSMGRRLQDSIVVWSHNNRADRMRHSQE